MRRKRGDEGATTVEYALVLPLFLGLISIGAYFAWIFYAQTQVDRAANRAARTAAVPTTAGEYGYCQDLVKQQVNNALFSASITDDKDVVVSDGTGTVLAVNSTGGICGETPSGFVKVRVSHEFGNPFSSVVGWFTGAGSGLKVTGTGQVRVEHE